MNPMELTIVSQSVGVSLFVANLLSYHVGADTSHRMCDWKEAPFSFHRSVGFQRHRKPLTIRAESLDLCLSRTCNRLCGSSIHNRTTAHSVGDGRRWHTCRITGCTTCLCVSKRGGWRGIPVELLGWCLHVKAAELKAQAYGGISGDQQRHSKGVLDHVMLYGVARRRGSRGDPELAVNRGQVPVDRAGADDELLGYLGIGEPLCYQA